MADKVGDIFTGYVTGVAAFGLFVELTEHFVEGLVHISSMADDYYHFVEGAHTLRGENRPNVRRSNPLTETKGSRSFRTLRMSVRTSGVAVAVKAAVWGWSSASSASESRR